MAEERNGRTFKLWQLMLSCIATAMLVLGFVFGSGEIKAGVEHRVATVEREVNRMEQEHARKDVVGARLDSIERSLNEIKSLLRDREDRR